MHCACTVCLQPCGRAACDTARWAPTQKGEPQRNHRDRGVALEGLRRWDDAIADYKAVLKAAPNDPSAWNNLGNPNAALGRWDVAEQVPSIGTLHAEHNLPVRRLCALHPAWQAGSAVPNSQDAMVPGALLKGPMAQALHCVPGTQPPSILSSCCYSRMPQCFGKAAALAPEFAFAAGNQALALFQLGQTDKAVRQMR